MRAVRARNSAPEMAVRRLVHEMGFRYRLHASDLPGTPDLVFRRKRKVIFVHGCFWHGHNCKRARRPATNVNFWNAKLSQNIRRDSEQIEALISMNWMVLVIWGCEIKDHHLLQERLREFLAVSGPTQSPK